MLRSKDIKDEIESVGDLKELIDIYGQIASIRMRKIRDSVLKNREFFDSVNSIFQDTLNSYIKKISQLKLKGEQSASKVTFLAHNNKTVAVFISANTGFYGEIIQIVFRKFLDDVRKNDFEVTIVGRLGRNLFLQEEPKRPYTYYDLPDYGTDQQEFAEVVKHLVKYERIKVYYSRYKSVISQIPYVGEISAGAEVKGESTIDEREFIFEPSIEDVLTFFETEIFVSFFNQSVQDSQLSKLASRIISMDKALENIRKKIGDLHNEKTKILHSEMAKKQINSLSNVIY